MTPPDAGPTLLSPDTSLAALARELFTMVEDYKLTAGQAAEAFDSAWNRRAPGEREADPRVKKLREALSNIVMLDHHNHGPESPATKIARAALAETAGDE